MATTTTKELPTGVAYGDEVAAQNLIKYLEESGGGYDDGVKLLSLAGERCTLYLGRVIRFTHPKIGPRVAVIGGVNCRWTNTKRGRGEIVWGNPSQDEWDPVPGVMFPAAVEITSHVVSNNFTPRSTKYDAKIAKMCG